MIWFRRTILALTLTLTFGCTSFGVPPSLPPLDERHIAQMRAEFLPKLELSAAFLEVLMTQALVVFDGDCPVEVVDLVNHCPPGLGGSGAICRGEPGNSKGVSTIVKFTSGAQQKNIGIEFLLEHPCVQPAGPMKIPNSHTKICTIKDLPGDVWTILKYKVIADSCDLDPYVILVR